MEDDGDGREPKGGGVLKETAGLYVHVPFCGSLCSYCDFFRVANDGAAPGWFVTYIIKEGKLYREPEPITLASVYFGGGTPSLIAPPDFARLSEGLREIFAWPCGIEATLEANPETVTREALAAWRSAGITRLSIGAQSLQGEELSLLGRRAAPSDVRRAVLLASEAGFDRLSLDLMLAIPGQSPGSLARTLDEVAAMPLDHVSAYMLDLHEGTPLYARVVAGGASLPDEDEVADLYEQLCGRLEASGFLHYEVSNFAKPNGECRHNLRYWRGGDYIGLGPSAHGCFRGERTNNPRSIGEWRAALDRDEPPYEITAKVTERERFENSVIFGLRLAEGIKEETLASFLEAQGRGPEQIIGQLLRHGYAARRGDGRIRLTRLGFLSSNSVIEYLLPKDYRA